jgi:autotransporter-associated beta strand protein
MKTKPTSNLMCFASSFNTVLRSIVWSGVAMILLCLALFTVPVAHAATTGFNQTGAGPYDYNTTGNWVGGTINGIWDTSLTLAAGQTVTFAADTTLATALNFNYAGNFPLALTASAGTPHSLTLGGDLNLSVTNGAAAIVTIGDPVNVLNVNLGNTARNLNVATNRTLIFLNAITSSGTSGGITLTNLGTVILAGTNTYTGPTIVGGGNTLTVNGTGIIGGANTLLVGGTGSGVSGANAVFNYYSSGSSTNITGFTLGAGGTGSPTGVMNMTNGTFTVNQLSMGTSKSAKGILNLSGGTLNVSGTGSFMNVGVRGGDVNASLATVNVTNGTLNVPLRLTLGAYSSGGYSQGIINQFGGTVYAPYIQMTQPSADADNHVATYNLNGGTLYTGGMIGAINTGGGVNYMTNNFNGGILKPLGSSTNLIQGLTACNVQNGGAIIDVTTTNVVTIAQPLLHYPGATTDGLTKIDTGTLILAAANTYAGITTVSNGTLALVPGGSIYGEVSIGAGTTFDVSAISAYVLSATSSLGASGTTNPATLKGASGGTVSLGSQPIILNYDGTNTPLTVSQGQLVLTGNAYTINHASFLADGDYVIITNVGNIISSSGSSTVTGTAVTGKISSIVVSGSTVTLHVATAALSIANSTVTASPPSLPADNSSTSTVTITLRDPSNNPIAGLSGIIWSVSGSDNTVVPASTGSSDVNGQCTFTVQSFKAETKLVTVTVGASTITSSLAITFTAPGGGNAFIWDAGHTTTGGNTSGTWDTSSANWANSGADFAWPNNGNDTATFGLSGPLSGDVHVTVGSPVTVGNMNFLFTTGGQYYLDGTNHITLSGTPTLTLDGAVMINCPLAGTGFSAYLPLSGDAGSILRIAGDNPNYTGNIALNGYGKLQFGNNSAAGNLGSGTITLNDSVNLIVRRQGGSMVLSNQITGSTAGVVGFQLNGGVVVTLAQANTYSAPTYQQPSGAANNSGTIRLGINNALPTATDFTMDNGNAYGGGSGSPGSVQTFDLAGFNQTLNSLATDAYATPANTIITNSAAIAGTLTLAGAGVSTTFGGEMVGKVNLTLNGSGSTLTVQQTNSLSAASIVTVSNGAALDLAFTGTNQIAGLVVNGVSKPAGVYSAATDSPYLVDTGCLLVQPVATMNPNPTNILFSVNGNTLNLHWPADHLGWYVQSNSVALANTNDWFNIPNSQNGTNLAITIDATKGNVFYRMSKP